MIEQRISGPLDPFVSWFNVTAPQRPLNPYQLFSLPELDDNLTRIRSAIMYRRDQLEMHRATSEPELWNSVREEIDQAASILLDYEEKALFDAQLRRRNRHAKALEQFEPDPSASVPCHDCEAENPGSRKYCLQCGAPLYIACAECHSVGPANERFCGTCGANTVDALEGALQRAQSAVDRARALRAEGRFNEALKLLFELMISHDTRLESVIRQAAALRREWRAERSELGVAAEKATDDAAERVEAHDFEGAIALLKPFPGELRSQRATSLLREAETMREQVGQLENEIRAAVRAKQLGGLGTLIDNLLRLVPQHTQARSLAPKVGRALEQAAQKALEEGKYESAQRYLDEIPQAARQDSDQKLREHVAEMAWLANSLRQAVRVDPMLIGIVERLSKHAPQDRTVKEWQSQLQDLQAKKLLARGGPAPWVTRPQRSGMGMPVTTWDGPSRIAAEPEAAAVLRDQGGLFANAFGLALQGLDQARYAINIMPEKRRGLLGSLPLSRKRVETAWGIDVGRTGIKAAQLARRDTGRLIVQRCLVIAHKQPAIDSAADRQAMLSESLDAFAREAGDLKQARICLGMPSISTLLKTLRLPPMKDKRFEDAVQYEVKHAIPMDLADLCWGYQRIDAESSGSENADGVIVQQRLVFVVASKRVEAEAFLAPFRAAGINVDVLQSTAVALANLFAYEAVEALGRTDKTPALGILDVGAGSSSFLVLGAASPWFRSLPFCGDAITARIAHEFQLTRAQAEDVKRDPLRAKRIHKLYAAIDPLLKDLTTDLRNTLGAWQRETNEAGLSDLVLVGGGARLHGLVRWLYFGGPRAE